MSYNPIKLPLLRGFHKKIKHSRERLREEIGILSLSLGVNYLDSPERDELEEIVSLIETAEDKIDSLTKRTKTIIKALER